jgi:hypothetical protein
MSNDYIQGRKETAWRMRAALEVIASQFVDPYKHDAVMEATREVFLREMLDINAPKQETDQGEKHGH